MRFGPWLLVLAASIAAHAAPTLPYHFEENRGQADPSVRYLARGAGYHLQLTGEMAVITLAPAGETPRPVRMRLAGAAAPPLRPVASPTGVSHYRIGARSTWVDAPQYASVAAHGVYPGVDLVYHSQAGQLEYDFVVAAGADPAPIALRFEGADAVSVTPDGDLALRLGRRTLVHRRPVAYQERDGRRETVSAAYRLTDGRIGFTLGAYDRSRPLVIDPVVVYSSYFGGDRTDIINAVAVDAEGNTYLAGETTSANFPIVGTNHTQLQGAVVYGFVTKINAAGDRILFSTFLGGSSNTRAYAIAVDPAGNVYVGGVTGSKNFPLVNPVQATHAGLNIGFVTKLSPTGEQILFSTFWGGERNDTIYALALDPAGNIYVAGLGNSTNFPVVNAMQPATGGSSDAVIAKYAAPDYRLAYSTFLGGTGADEAYAMTVDAQGGVYVAGHSISPNLATPGAAQAKTNGSYDAFLARIRPDGRALSFFTYLGGQNEDNIQGIGLDAEGNVWATGYSNSGNFPVTANAIQKEKAGVTDAFLARLSGANGSLLYSTYYGGVGGTGYTEEGRALTLDRWGHVIFAGGAHSPNFPTVRPVQSFGGGSQDAFVAVYDPPSNKILFSTTVGGAGLDVIHGVAVDPLGGIRAVGETQSSDFPLKGALRSTFAAGSEGLLTSICDPRLVADAGSMTFTVLPNGPASPQQTLRVSACTAIPFQVSATLPNLKFNSTTGLTNGTVTIQPEALALGPGAHGGKIILTSPDALNSPLEIPFTLIVQPPPPVISAAGVANAASSKGGAVAPGEIVVIYGTNLGPAQLAGLEVEFGKVANALAGTRVWFDDVAAPIVYTSSGQVSAIVPYSVSGKPSTVMVVEAYSVRSNPVTLTVTAASPALFTANASGTGQGSILNQDSSVNNAAHPASRGQIVVLYLTGEGQTDPAGADGQLATAVYPKPLQPVRVWIDEQPAEVLYAGAAPGLVAGVMQVNVRVPEGARVGNAPVRVEVGSTSSPQGVTVAVQ